jgi:hypothetical protein
VFSKAQVILLSQAYRETFMRARIAGVLLLVSIGHAMAWKSKVIDADGTPQAIATVQAADGTQAGLSLSCLKNGRTAMIYITNVPFAVARGRDPDMLARIRVDTIGSIKVMFSAQEMDGRLLLMASADETRLDLVAVVRFLTKAQKQIVLTLHNDLPNTDLTLSAQDISPAMMTLSSTCGFGQ